MVQSDLGRVDRAPGGFVRTFVRLSLCLSLASGLGCAGAGKTAAPPAGTAGASILAAGATPSAVAASSADDLPLPINAQTHVATLPNGVRWYVRAHREPQKRASLRLVVNAGSVLEEDNERGFAHFVEHMAFNGTRLFKKQEIVNFIESVGMRFGQHANASTSFDETIYSFEVPTNDPAVLEKSFLMLQQLASDVSFDAAEVNSERGVVIEEWRMGLGANMRALEKIFPVLFKGSRYAERLPIGKKNILEQAKAEDLRAFYKRWYRPDLMAVIAVGDFDMATVEGYIKKYFGPIAAPPGAPARPSYPVPDHAETLVSIVKDKEMSDTSVSVFYKLPPQQQTSRRDYRRSIVEGIYHRMMNSRLEELSRGENPPFLGAGSARQPFVRTKDVFMQLAATKADGVPLGLQALTREVERVDKHGFTAGELDRQKVDVLRDLERAVLEKDKAPSDGYASEMVRNYLKAESMPGIDAELAMTKEFLPTITLAEMNKVASEWITERNRVLLVQAPEAAPIPSEPDLRTLFAKAEAAPIGPYVDKVGTGPLIGALPKPGQVVKESQIAEVGLTEWKLSNGIRVLIKATDFKNDEVLLHGRSPGGHSLVKDADFESATYAAGIIGSSGIGTFGPTELRKALAGKAVGVSPYIDELEEGMRGQASPDDLETLFQLVYLTATAPRKDEALFAAFREQLAEQLERRLAEPEAEFADKWQLTYYKNHPRRRPPDVGLAKRLSLDTMMRIYRERFADLGDATFVLVGRIDLAKLRPLVEQYLATLPTKRRKETFRDIGVRPIGGVHKFTVARGQEPKSQVRMTFNGTATFSSVEEHRLESLGETLSIRLREKLREELGGTYSVSVGGHLVRKPRQVFRSEVHFNCAPENVTKLVDAVKAEIATAKAKGPPPENIEKVKIAQNRSLEQSLRSNGYWMGEIVNRARYNEDPRLILEQKKLIDGLDAKGLQQAAKHYFPDDRVLFGLLEPAATTTPTPAPAKPAPEAAKPPPKPAAQMNQ
jgi:zinc protease